MIKKHIVTLNKRRESCKDLDELKCDEIHKIEEKKDDFVERKEKFYSYYIYLNENNDRIIGSIYLTENQAYNLNVIFKKERIGINIRKV